MRCAEFLYVFALMFVSIFGLEVLIKLLAWAVIRPHGKTRFTVQVKADEHTAEFVEFALSTRRINCVEIIPSGTESDEAARLLAEKYPTVVLVGEKWEK